MNSQMLMDKLLKAVSYQFKDDTTCPGITVAALKKGYYCSVIRYTGSFANGKEVVCKAKGDTWELALQATAKVFLEKVKAEQNPVEELDQLFAPTWNRNNVIGK